MEISDPHKTDCEQSMGLKCTQKDCLSHMKNAKPFEKSNFQCNAIRQPAGHVERKTEVKNKNGKKDNFKEKESEEEGREK